MDRSSKEQFVHQVFESIASKYDVMNSVISFRRHKAWRKFAMRKMNVQAGQSAIDVCCGTGDWTLSMAEATGPDGRVVGIDFSQNMLHIGQAKKEKAGLEHIHLELGNAMDLKHEDDTFDYATIGFALRNVPDINQVLAEMLRVIKPGGMVVSLELSKPEWPIFKQMYHVYLYYILPLIGKIFANRFEQYRWLPESLRNFPDRKRLAQIFAETGMEHVQSWRLAGGVAALHIGHKPLVNRQDEAVDKLGEAK